MFYKGILLVKRRYEKVGRVRVERLKVDGMIKLSNKVSLI